MIDGLWDIWLWLPPIALGADALLGDSPRAPHPVRWIGWGANRVEALARQWAQRRPHVREKRLRTAGAAGMVFLALMAGGLAQFAAILPVLGLFLALYLAYAGLAMGQLLKEGRLVIRLLENEDIEGARAKLALLVSRDTRPLDEDGIRRALAETLSENINDGFVAPFFYLVIGGPWGVGVLWAYKAVSTLDSMWGYKTERYRDFGRAAARMDDVLAYIPARLTALALFVGASLGAGGIGGVMPFGEFWRRVKSDAALLESPNAGWPMAAASWLLQGRMGGPTVYFGKLIDKPWRGPDEAWGLDKLRRMIPLLFISGAAAAAVMIFSAWCVWG